MATVNVAMIRPYRRASPARAALRARLDLISSRARQRPLELYLSLLALLWGFWLGLPFDTFASTPSFAAMRALGWPEWAWGVGIFAIGLAQFVGLMTLRRHVLRLGLVGGVGLWTFVAAMLIIANPVATATVVYPLAAVASLWRLHET